ncbi:DDT domain-containing protein PTM isoform X7 [Diospyros lotus]|uniref:DDT domain-containing protein PTM isoform X7 n=1 Tax=Diospyros lotus TaxID=55363 RepID=UPI002254F7B0|nr:DDT domain-containing protein PTM isoform X7 [Diospyros lotus]
MEFVGKTLKKEFAGLGVFAGVVNSYDASTGFFEILYEDGDSEELELSEVSSLFNGAGLGTGSVTGDQSAAEFELANEPRVRRKPKKRRRLLADSGNRTSANFTSDSLTESREEIILRQDGTSQQGFSRDTVSAMGNLSSGGCNGVKPDNGLDLNVGLNLTEGFSLSEGANLNVHFEELPRRNGCIDLNLDANGELEELREGNLGNPGAETQKGKRCFDLNMVLDEEGKNSDSDCEGQLKETTSLHVVEETEKQEKEGLEMVGGVKNQEQACFGIVAGTQVEPVAGYAENDVGDSCVTMIKDAPKADGASGGSEGGGVPVTTYANDSIPSQVQVKKELPEGDSGIACKERNRRKSIKTSENISFIKETVLRRSSQRLAMVDSRVGFQEAVEREKGVSGEFLGGTTPGATVATGFLSSDVELKEGFTSTGTDTDTTADNSYQVNTGMTSKERQRKRRRKLSDSAVETVLRRSSRRLAASLNPQNHISSEATSVADNEAQSSAAVSAVLDEKLAIPDREESEEDSVLPPKLPLPPSSENLNLDGIPILDLFSVYACLRSFSTLLFLSPFELEDFVAALRCEAPNLLLDFIHVSLLKTLRKHLELLSGENSVSASNCLRSLNWDLLDVITWPIFMMEYLLIHGSALRPGFELCKLNVLESGYYKQPAPVKIEILQCLCDDVIEMQAIRSELDRRTQAIELNMDTDWSTKIEGSKRRRTSVDISGGSCLTEEVVDETTDWNSDECCLCKMDGSLICCDGCPAAYHLRCVGVSSNLMPEGDWYCPECMIDRDKPWLKLGKSIRGADLLGIDPHGRLYHSSCGYLLVSDSHENEQSYRYYNINDLGFVIEALKSLNTLYNPIIGAILKQWNISVYLNGAKSYKDSPNPTPCPELMKGQIGTVTMLPLHLAPSGTCPGEEIINERKPEENSTAAQYSGSTDFEVSALVNNAQVTSNNFVKMENLLTSSEGSAETSLATAVQNLQKTGPDGFNRSPGTLNGSEIQGKILSVGDSPLTSTNFDGEQGKNIQSAVCGHILSISDTRKGETPRRQVETSYMNYYSLAQTASSVAEELSHKSSEKINESSTKSVEDIILAQLKAISKKSTKFSWPNIQKLNADARKEKCGWCFSCKASDDERDCFFNLSDSAPTDLMNEVVGLCSQWNKKDHLVDVMGYILSIEDRLRGLLSGPWLNPHYSKLWRKNVANASDVTSLKHFLLMLESNLRPLALSADWVKHVDSVPILGSACHIVSSSLRVSSRHGMGRKRARYSDLEANNSSNAARGLGLLWWRGGRLSRKLFNWKGLPRSLALKAARQGGCTKVPGILYLDSSEFSRRSQHVAWRAAVEHSKSVEQLALQVRELDANIRWDDIENTNVLLKMDQFRKSVRPFKKVIIRRKCTEGAVVKYLLDFGKRRIIPDVVVTHGYTVEESSSGRKKYWLEESLVPLHLLKAFEEKRIARKSNKMSSGKLNASGRITRKISRNRGFEYLFAKAEKSEYYQCGHCKKDVLIREAVSCQYCKGFFHKRHVRKSAGPIITECTWICHKCHNGNPLKVEKQKRIAQSQKSKKASSACRVLRPRISKKASKDKKIPQKAKNKKDTIVLPLRRSPRKIKYVGLQNKKPGGRKKGKRKQIKSRKVISKRPKKGTWQKKRTPVCHAYWLNGVFLSRKPNDERVMHFRSRKFVAPSEQLTDIVDRPKCSLCGEQEFASTLNYVGCEICGEWYHGDAFGLMMENFSNLIGFRCHKCRNRASPICPHLHRKTSDEAQLDNLNEDVSIPVAVSAEELEEHKFHADKEAKHPSFDDKSGRTDWEPGNVPNLNQLNAENELTCASNEQQIREAIQIPEEQILDPSTESGDHASLAESTIDSGTEHSVAASTLVKTESLSSKSEVDVASTNTLSSTEHSVAASTLVKTESLSSKSEVDVASTNTLSPGHMHGE